MRSLRQHLPAGSHSHTNNNNNETVEISQSPRNVALKVPRALASPTLSPRPKGLRTPSPQSPWSSPLVRPSATLQPNAVNYISESRMNASATTWRGYARRTTPLHTATASGDVLKLRSLIVDIFGDFSPNPYVPPRSKSQVVADGSLLDPLTHFQLPPADNDAFSKSNFGRQVNLNNRRHMGTSAPTTLASIEGATNNDLYPFSETSPQAPQPEGKLSSLTHNTVYSHEATQLSTYLPVLDSPNPNQRIADYLDCLYDADGHTPIFIAIEKNCMEVFRLLAYDIGCHCPPPPHSSATLELLSASSQQASIGSYSNSISPSINDHALYHANFAAQNSPQAQLISIARNQPPSSAGLVGGSTSISGGVSNQLFPFGGALPNLTPRPSQASIPTAPIMLTRAEGRTALHCAAYHGHKEVLDYLLNTCGWGWDPSNGIPPRTETLSTGGDNALGAGGSYASIAVLGSDAGRTALHCAVVQRNKEAVKALSDAGCNLNAKDGSGHTPLIIAVAQGDTAMTTLLLSLRGGAGKLKDQSLHTLRLPSVKNTLASNSRSSSSSGCQAFGMSLSSPIDASSIHFPTAFPYSIQPCDPSASTRGGYTAHRLAYERGLHEILQLFQR